MGRLVRVRKEDWNKNDISTMEKLGIIKFTGNQWNAEWEFPDVVPKKMADKLRRGYYQPDCPEMKTRREKINSLLRSKTTEPHNMKPNSVSSAIHTLRCLQNVLEANRDKTIRNFICEDDKVQPKPLPRRSVTVMNPVEFNEMIYAKELRTNSINEWKFLETACNIIKSYDKGEVSDKFLADTITATIHAYRNGNFASQERCNEIAEKKFFYHQEIMEEEDSIEIGGDALNAFLTLCDYGIFDLAMKNYLFLGVAIRDRIEPILKRFEIKLKRSVR